jgi:hypothetical protein
MVAFRFKSTNRASTLRPEYRPWPFGQIDVAAGALTARGSKQAAGRFVSTSLHLAFYKRHNFVRGPDRCLQFVNHNELIGGG